MEPRLPYTACCNLAPFIFFPPASIAFREAIITEFTAKNATQSALDTFFLVPAFPMQTFVSTKYCLYVSTHKYFDRFGKQSLSSPLFSTDPWFRGTWKTHPLVPIHPSRRPIQYSVYLIIQITPRESVLIIRAVSTEALHRSAKFHFSTTTAGFPVYPSLHKPIKYQPTVWALP